MRATQHRGCCVSGRVDVDAFLLLVSISTSPSRSPGGIWSASAFSRATLEACWGWGWGWLPLYAGKVGCVDGHLEDPARPSSPPPGECL